MIALKRVVLARTVICSGNKRGIRNLFDLGFNEGDWFPFVRFLAPHSKIQLVL